MRKTTWPDQIEVHPAADLFPMMTDIELDELAADIAKHGLQQKIVWLMSPNGPDQLLDGRNRVAAIYRIADCDRREELLETIRFPKGKNSHAFLQHPDPHAYVASANLHRRHLTADQKRDVVAALLKANPNRSDRATAKIAHIDGKTVASIRADLERRAEIPHVDTRSDSLGRRQPARKTTKPAAAAHAEPAPAPEAVDEPPLPLLLPAQPQPTSALSTPPHTIEHWRAETFEAINNLLEKFHRRHNNGGSALNGFDEAPDLPFKASEVEDMAEKLIQFAKRLHKLEATKRRAARQHPQQAPLH
jgi:hypothetical protein